MHASRIRSGFIAALLGRVAASPTIIPRDVTESALAPWVSVDASGTPIATITPVLATISGIPTTISAAPVSLTAATTTQQGDSKPTTTSGEAPTSTGGGAFIECNNPDGEFAPFCEPGNGSSVYVGETYYVTWDTKYFPESNMSLRIVANYVNATGGGLQAFESPITQNYYGFISWTIDKTWLRGESYNNVTLSMVLLTPNPTEPRLEAGPTVMITNRPPTYYQQPPTKAPTGASLYIALPTVFGFIILCVCGGAIINRKHRKIGLGNVMGRRNGYSSGKSRSERLGLRKKKEGAIELREQELTADGQYRDVPDSRGRGHARVDSDLGSLAGSETGDRTNYFRDEMRRQEQRS